MTIGIQRAMKCAEDLARDVALLDLVHDDLALALERRIVERAAPLLEANRFEGE